MTSNHNSDPRLAPTVRLCRAGTCTGRYPKSKPTKIQVPTYGCDPDHVGLGVKPHARITRRFQSQGKVDPAGASWAAVVLRSAGWVLLLAAINTGSGLVAQDDAWLAEDKQQHAAAGYLIGLGTALVVEQTMPDAHWTTKLAIEVAVGALVGVAKEISDHQDPANHTSDWRDAAATIGGSALGGLSATLVFRF